VECCLDTGRSVRFDHALVVGASPVAPRPFARAALVRVDDPTCTVAGTHVAVVMTGAELWVVDLSCGHDTSVVLPSGPVLPVHPGSSLSVPVGAVVRFGERWLQILAAGPACPPTSGPQAAAPSRVVGQRTVVWSTKRVSSNSL
jgi:hypothetical protein